MANSFAVTTLRFELNLQNFHSLAIAQQPPCHCRSLPPVFRALSAPIPSGKLLLRPSPPTRVPSPQSVRLPLPHSASAASAKHQDRCQGSAPQLSWLEPAAAIDVDSPMQDSGRSEQDPVCISSLVAATATTLLLLDPSWRLNVREALIQNA